MQSFRGQACLEENVWVPYDLLILLKAAVMVHLMEVAGLLKGNFFFFLSYFKMTQTYFVTLLWSCKTI